MDWHPLPDTDQQLTLELAFGEDGVIGGWLDASGEALAMPALETGAMAAPGDAPLSALSEWTPFAEAETTAADWLEDSVPLAAADALSDTPLVAELPEDVRLDGLVEHGVEAALADTLGGDSATVIGDGQTAADASATSALLDGPEIVIFEFLA